MCYDLSFSSNLEKISDYIPHLAIEAQLNVPFFEASEHVIAQGYRPYPIVLFLEGSYRLKAFEWGVIADYMNTPEKIRDMRSQMCNSRSEKILDKKSYWYRIRTHRCLIPVTGIFEHRQIKGWKNKVPYFVRIKKRSMFFIPGLYTNSRVVDEETGELVEKGTFSLITRGANQVMAQIHNGGPNKSRMPLFLEHGLELEWLKPDLTDQGIREILDYEMPSEQLDYWPVWSIRTSRPRPDGEGKTDPYVWEDLPGIDN